MKDGTGAFIKKIILENPTDEQVINSLWSVSGFNRQASANLAKRYKEILGGTSDACGMVRQAAFDKIIIKKTIDGRQVVDGARSFASLEKAQQQGSSLLKVIFTPEEMAKISRYVRLAKRTVPDHVRSRENPSGTAKKLKEGFGSVRAFLPFIDVGLSVSVSSAAWLKNSGPKAAARNAFKSSRQKRPFSEARLKIMKNLKEIGGALVNAPDDVGQSMKTRVAESVLMPQATAGVSSLGE